MAESGERETVSVWVGKGRWVSIPVGTPERPLTDEELRQALFELDCEAIDRSVTEPTLDAFDRTNIERLERAEGE